MTALLLDTHAYVWAVTAPEHLSAPAREAIRASSNSLIVSAATVWEMAIKHRAGKWPEAEPLLADHDAIRSRLGAVALDISSAHARRAGLLSWEHPDPFDRMLAAQAVTEDATLVTRDHAFDDVAGLATLW